MGKDEQSQSIDKAKTFEDWHQIWLSSEAGSELETRSFEEIKKLAKTFTEWENVFGETVMDSEEEKEAINRMVELATTQEDWEQIEFWAHGQFLEIHAMAQKKIKEIIEEKLIFPPSKKS
jgi:hypothetical protein